MPPTPTSPPPPTPEDDVDRRFKAIWVYCMMLHPGVGNMVTGPCMDCVSAYAVTGPPPRPEPSP